MKRLTLFVVFLCVLQACASYSPYQPAGKNGYGYRHTQLSETQYRVDFKARDLEQGKAVDFAMLRAAELTLEKGYDWFEVVDRESDLSHQHPDAGFNLTLGSGIYHHSRSSVFFGTGLRDTDEGIVTVLLEINMGKGNKPDAQRVYSANALVEKLRQALGMEQGSPL